MWFCFVLAFSNLFIICLKQWHRFNPLVSKLIQFPYEYALEFEAMLNTLETIDSQKKLQIIVCEHMPARVVSKLSNVPEYDHNPIIICESNPRSFMMNIHGWNWSDFA